MWIRINVYISVVYSVFFLRKKYSDNRNLINPDYWNGKIRKKFRYANIFVYSHIYNGFKTFIIIVTRRNKFYETPNFTLLQSGCTIVVNKISPQSQSTFKSNRFHINENCFAFLFWLYVIYIYYVYWAWFFFFFVDLIHFFLSTYVE